MRLRFSLLSCMVIPIFLAVPNLFSQIFDLSGGASTLYGAQGASIIIHGNNTETSIGAGLLQGRFTAGGATARKAGDGLIVAGQQEFSVNVPTDIFDTSHVFFGTGAGFHQNPGVTNSLNAFAGLSSVEAGTPMFQSVDIGKLAAFTQWEHALGASCASLTTALLSSSYSFLQSGKCSVGKTVTVAATAGMGGRGRYEALSALIKEKRLAIRAAFIDLSGTYKRGNDLYQLNPEPVRENVSAEYQLSRTTTVSGLHQNYMTPVSSSSGAPFTELVGSKATLRSSLENASIRYGARNSGLSFAIMHSTTRAPSILESYVLSGGNVAVFAGLSHNFGRLQWTEHFFRTMQRDGQSSAVLINGLSATINPHLRVTEAANVAASGTTFSHGGAFVTRFSSFAVDYQILYLASRPANPFQQAMVFDAQLRLSRGVWLHAASSVNPTGSTLYTFRLGTVLSHNASSPDPISASGLGMSVLRGRVLDRSGAPIEGAAVMVDSTRLYTDTQGYFFYRERASHSHAFKVLPDEFMGVGNFIAVSMPKEVRTSTRLDADLVTVIIAQTPGDASPLGDRSKGVEHLGSDQ